MVNYLWSWLKEVIPMLLQNSKSMQRTNMVTLFLPEEMISVPKLKDLEVALFLIQF
jgi:hypothetical protein